MCQLPRVSVQTVKGEGLGSRAPHQQGQHGRNPWQSFAGLVSVDVCTHAGPRAGTVHGALPALVLYLLFNRTPGEISPCLLFLITTEKAGLPSVSSSAGDSSKPGHSDYRHFQTFLKNVQVSLVVSFSATILLFPIQSFFSSTRPV